MAEFLSRWMTDRVVKALQVRRVVSLAGVRQCGKTTLVRHLLGEGVTFRSLDDPLLLRSALEDPAGFLKTGASTLVVDELQKAPDLLPLIKMAVDESSRCGQFLLTGSANIAALPQIAESLAGRLATLRLRTLTIGEIMGRPPRFLQNVFNGRVPDRPAEADREAILRLAFRGGYPEALALDESDRREWLQDYLAAILARDLADLANIRRRDALRQLVEVLAAWSAKELNFAEMGSTIGIARQTLDSYVGALEMLYLFEQVPCWIATDYARVGRRPKWYCADSGLMSAVLRWRFDEVVQNPDRAGKLLETFVFHELAAQADLDRCGVFHYRDRNQHEVDFVVESERGDLLGIEVKTGSLVRKDDFKGLFWFREHIAKTRRFTGIVLYTGRQTVPFGDGMKAVPVSALWESQGD